MKYLRLTPVLLLLSLVLALFGCSSSDADDNRDTNDDRFDERNFEVQLAGENQVPPVASPAMGTMEVTLDENNVLTVDGAFSDLSSPLIDVQGSSAHIHVGSLDEGGPIVFLVNVDADGNDRGGTFTLTETLSADQVRVFEAGDYFLNIHTEAYPDGELRGQLTEEAPEYADLDETWGVELTPEAQPHEVESDGMGWAWAILRDDDSFMLSGALNNIEGRVTEVQLMRGEDEGPGTIIATLESEEHDDGGYRFWYNAELNEDQINDLKDGMYFINVYTTDEPLGELRGRLDDANNFFENLWDDIFGDDPIETVPPF